MTDIGATPRARRRWPAVALLVFGVALAVMPFAMGVSTKAPKGAVMLRDFKPFMTNGRINRFEADMAEIDAAVREAQGPARTLLTASKGSTAAATTYASFDAFTPQWPTIHADMTDMLRRVDESQAGYQAMASLPSFSLFPWFFIGPGVLLVLAGALLLVRPSLSPVGIGVALVAGLALVVLPFAVGLFSKAPKGAQMMNRFRDLMTVHRVHTIQGYFGTMAVGEGALRLQIVPALQAVPFTDAQLQHGLPAVTRLDRDWIPIINDMTPMIGAMSDNVANYQGLRSMPSFSLFPWFFLAPGVIAVALALAQARPDRDRTDPDNSKELHHV